MQEMASNVKSSKSCISMLVQCSRVITYLQRYSLSSKNLISRVSSTVQNSAHFQDVNIIWNDTFDLYRNMQNVPIIHNLGGCAMLRVYCSVFLFPFPLPQIHVWSISFTNEGKRQHGGGVEGHKCSLTHAKNHPQQPFRCSSIPNLPTALYHSLYNFLINAHSTPLATLKSPTHCSFNVHIIYIYSALNFITRHSQGQI